MSSRQNWAEINAFSPRAPDAAELRRLTRLEAAPPLRVPQIHALQGDLTAAIRAESRLAIDRDGLDSARHQAGVEKWRLIQRYLLRQPFRDDDATVRSAQWRAAARRLEAIGDSDLDIWLALQAEVAGNLERGVRDMRPRKLGPTCLVTLEYAANRKRQSHAALKWALAWERNR